MKFSMLATDVWAMGKEMKNEIRLEVAASQTDVR